MDFSAYHSIKLGAGGECRGCFERDAFGVVLDKLRDAAKAYAIKFPSRVLKSREVIFKPPRSPPTGVDLDETSSTNSSSDIPSVACVATHGHRELCEPECNDFPRGEYHPCCSASYFLQLLVTVCRYSSIRHAHNVYTYIYIYIYIRKDNLYIYIYI